IGPHFVFDAQHLSKFNGHSFVCFINEPFTANDFWDFQVCCIFVDQFSSLKSVLAKFCQMGSFLYLFYMLTKQNFCCLAGKKGILLLHTV
ncbi:hypothetical protein PAXRUDRAFT_804639, partial [Paxillus rubicundulus Ve08.2h10]